MYRTVNHLVEIPASTILQPWAHLEQVDKSTDITDNYCSVDAYKLALFSSGIRLWNSLPTETVSVQSPESFKTLIMDMCP